jgi:hypothetical protein
MWPALISLLGSVFERVFPDPLEKAKMMAQLMEIQAQADQAQIQVNANEAASGNWFAADWRPAIAWVCTLAFVIEYLLKPILEWTSIIVGHPMPTLPSLDMGTLMPLTFALLGLGGMRTYENVMNKVDK